MFFSGISASKEVKKHQLRAQFLLDSYKIKYEMVDVSDPVEELSREKMLREAKRRTETQPPQPPQFYNEDEYCGDFEDLETANDNDELFKFLKLEEDVAIENGNGEQGEYDLFVPPDQREPPKEEEKEEEKKNEETVEDEEEEEKKEVVEQVTINGVVYTIPPDRKIEVGGRIIDVDELLATEGEEVDLEEVADDLKEQINTDKNDDINEDQEENKENLGDNDENMNVEEGEKEAEEE